MPVWRRLGYVAIVLVLASAYLIALIAPAVGTFHDDGVYIVTAKSLAENKGYRILSLPDEIAQTKYPILFPLLLSVIWRIVPEFPGNTTYLKMIPLSCGFVWLWLSWRWMREEGIRREHAAPAIAVAAAIPWVIYLSTAVMSETLFGLLTVACLLVLRRVEKEANPGRLIIVAAILAGLSFHTRTLGAALLMSAALFLLFKRGLKYAALFCSIAGAVCLPWLLWVAAQPVTSTDAYYSRDVYQGWNILLNFTLTQKLEIFIQNLLMQVLSPAMLAGAAMKGLWLLPAFTIGIALWVALFRFTLCLATRLFLALYIGMVLCWTWQPGRFVAVLIPFLAAAGYQLVKRLPSRVARPAVAILGVCLIGGVVRNSERTRRLGDALPTLKDHDRWTDLVKSIDWLRDHSDKDSVIAGNLDPLYYLMTNRKAVRGFSADPYLLIYRQSAEAIGAPSTLRANLMRAKADYWVVSPNSTFIEGKLLRQAETESLKAVDTLELVLEASSAHHHVYRLRRESSASDTQVLAPGALREIVPVRTDLK